MKGRSLLTAQQLSVTERVLAEAERCHLVVYLSGAHAYGFPSPDSDVDLKCVHIEASSRFLGLATPRLTFDRAEVIDSVEMDYTSNEVSLVLAGVLAGNGNYLERLLGDATIEEHRALDGLRPLVAGALSRRVHRHYRGFATSQRAELAKQPSAKKALYVLRTALTGAHLLTTGKMVTDVRLLLDRYGFESAGTLIEAKRRGERQPLDEADAAH
ncbi:MAG: nucleotidyltransferase domain-containing protein, partial [Myxococcales bacterium]|nr:nucleotidyltransferase domain-containing protein [Myxococcales bacterium]